jgi:alpha-beta hydrolase superfamily lysophospholipase
LAQSNTLAESNTLPDQTSRPRRWLKRLVVVFFVVMSSWLAVSTVVAYKLTRRPRPPYVETVPEVPWGAIESLRLRSSDGVDIGAWFTPGGREGPSVIILHGYNGSRKESIPLTEMLVHAGCSVLAITLRSHGDSGGEGNDIGYSARHDVVAAVDYVEQRRPGRPIYIDGTSMGAAAAIYAGGELQTRVAGYILECPFRDIRSAVRNRTRAFLPFPLGDIAYLGLDVVGPVFLPEINRMSPVDRIAEIPQSVPLLIMAGGRDNRARPEEVTAIYERAVDHARLIVFPEATHGGFYLPGGAIYRDAVLQFLRNTQFRTVVR